jgi:hypothetical protein
MNIVAISKSDGHIYESQPYIEEIKIKIENIVKQNMTNAGLLKKDYEIKYLSNNELIDLMS